MCLTPRNPSTTKHRIFDEVLVNAADNARRGAKAGRTTEIRVELGRRKGELSVWNNGRGPPVAVHKDAGVLVPELLFGRLLSGSNFDDTVRTTVGGRNGFGAKLANIFSTHFTVETVDQRRGLKLVQQWTRNMSEKGEAAVTEVSAGVAAEPYTKITFRPDLARLGGAAALDENALALFRRRAWDIAGCNPEVAVFVDGARVPVGSFSEYSEVFFRRPKGDAPFVTHEQRGGRWHVAAGVSAPGDGFSHVSFVNSIYTRRGGTHVTHVADQIASGVAASLSRCALSFAPTCALPLTVPSLSQRQLGRRRAAGPRHQAAPRQVAPGARLELAH